jgi:tRNA(Ile)-lysidine synthase
MSCPSTSLISRLAQTVEQHHLFTTDDTLIVAISGGADSTALLDLLINLPGYNNLKLIAAHLNHCLRGSESDADEEFCRLLAAKFGIHFEVCRVDVNALAASYRLNLEDAGRQARIRFLDEICNKYCAAVVVLAHHADDQAETVLMRLLRGSGMTGLSGMSYRNVRGYVRPLLDVSRADIEQYLRKRDLSWREDASNKDTTYLRNRIRHELLPLLETYNPAIRSNLIATASIITADERVLEDLTDKTFADSCHLGEGRVICNIGQLRTINHALRRRVLRHAYKKLIGNLEGVSLRHIEALCGLIDSDRPNGRVNLPHVVTAVREYDRLILIPKNYTESDTSTELLITETACYQLSGGITISITSADTKLFQTDPNSICLDLEAFPLPWHVRTFKPGDRIQPFGMSGRKKVKDIFIDRKISLSQRKRIPLLFCGCDLIWIAGVCPSELTRIETPSAATVRVTIHLQEA